MQSVLEKALAFKPQLPIRSVIVSEGFFFFSKDFFRKIKILLDSFAVLWYVWSWKLLFERDTVFSPFSPLTAVASFYCFGRDNGYV